MARFFTCKPIPDEDNKESVFAINLDRVKTITFTLARKQCIGAELQLDKDVEILRDDDAQELYDILGD